MLLPLTFQVASLHPGRACGMAPARKSNAAPTASITAALMIDNPVFLLQASQSDEYGASPRIGNLLEDVLNFGLAMWPTRKGHHVWLHRGTATDTAH